MFREHLRNSPFVRILVPFLLGLTSSTYVSVFHNQLLAIASLAILFLLLIWLHRFQTKSYGRRWVFGAVLNIFLLLSGNDYLSGVTLQRHVWAESMQNGTLLVRTLEHQKSTAHYEKYLVEIRQVIRKDQTLASSGRLECWINRDCHIQLPVDGQMMILNSKVSGIPLPANPGEFNYQQYLFHKAILGQTWIRKQEEIELIPAQGFTGIKPIATGVRTKLLSVYTRFGITGDENALLSALTFGVRDAISNEVNKAFSQSGAMHVLSVSGLHVGILYLVFSYMLGFLSRSKTGRWIRAILLIAFLWLYAFLTGLTPSVLRSAAMFSFVAAGQSLNREASIYNTLSASALILLMIDPFMLFDVGFQLSYLAVFSIVFFQPLLYASLNPKNYILDKLWQLTCLSLAAQVGTFPLSLYYFHQFPNYFILTNLVVVPLAAVILYLALLLLVMACIPIIAKGLAWVLMGALKGMLLSVSFIESLPGAVFQNINNPASETLVLYLLLIVVVCLITIRNRKLILASLALCIVLLGMNFYLDYRSLRQQYIAVFNIPGTTAVQICRGRSSYLYYGEFVHNTPTQLEYYMKGFNVAREITRSSMCYLDSTFSIPVMEDTLYIYHLQPRPGLDIISQAGARVVLLSKGGEFKGKIASPVPVDFLILRNNAKISLKEWNKIFNIRRLIVDSSCSANYARMCREQAESMHIPFHAVAQSGAFIATF